MMDNMDEAPRSRFGDASPAEDPGVRGSLSELHNQRLANGVG